MNVVIRGATPPLSFEERSLIVLETLEAATDADRRDGKPDSEMAPHPVPIGERLRKLPEAVLLMAGYYASRAPRLNDLLRRLR